MGKKEVVLTNFRDKMGELLPITGQLIIVTTVNDKGTVNAGLKSDFMRMVTEPPILGFSCNLAHHTAQNILQTHEFVVNIPGEEIIEKAMETAKDYPEGVNELEKAGLTAIPSFAVGPPRIAECLVHLECREEWNKTYKDEIIILGQVVSMSADEEFLEAQCEERYNMVRPLFPLGEWLYATLGEIKQFP
ncbi:MAG: flavin reductase family protein [Theionarchaea archaeon]|nr:flavin reductase family protein [Theionarchaea archaeon]MBU7037204.1 flavin reductase family protein [Theionarchaea archaeon]